MDSLKRLLLKHKTSTAILDIVPRWNERNAKKITMYSLNFYRNPARMGTILKNGYALIYGRSNKPEILEDIKDNDVVDEIHNVRGNWHAVNICVREEGKAQLMEIGQRGEAHYANEFTYKNVLIFGDNIKAGSIDQDFTFFDYL